MPSFFFLHKREYNERNWSKDMLANNPFLEDLDNYKRDIEPLQAAIEQTALYLSRTRNLDYQKCLDFVKKEMSESGSVKIVDPTVQYLARQKNGDRAKRTCKFSEYLNFVISNEMIMVPTMTVYFNPHQRKSYLAEYVDLNVALRDVHKKLMFDAMEKGNIQKMQFEDNNQSVAKYKNNSVSGAQVSPFNPLYNKSGHSTLTSTCRTTTSYANANNEWFLMGNRHYWQPNVVLAHLTATLKYTNMEDVRNVIETFSLHIPTVDQTMDVIKWSSRFYWTGRRYYDEIRRYVETFSDIERAAFVYVGDLHHLALYNDEFVRGMFTDFSMRAAAPAENPKHELSQVDEDIVVLSTLLCSSLMKARKLKSVLEDGDMETYGIVAATARHVKETLEKYRILIEGLWRPAVLPPSIAYIPGIKRRAVITSDTDSTIFTTQRWTLWYNDGEYFTDKCYDIGYTTTYLTSQMVKHKLAQMSANIGMVKEHLFRTEMKNEFYFPTFTLTNMAKHYFAFQSAQEGLILKQLKAEIKGVNMRDSTVPVEVMSRAKQYMEDLMLGVMKENTVTLDSLLKPINDIECKIFDDLTKGGFNYLKAIQVKDLESYIQKDDAPNIQHHRFWNEVFGPKYGHAPEPPYNAVRVSVDIPNKKFLQVWIEGIEDVELAERLKDWVVRNQKSYMTTMVLPLANLEVHDIPAEILTVIHERKIVSNIMNAFYITLESAGIHMKNKHFTKLVSDIYQEQGLPMAA